jgi:site-specific DNA-methyltransferase (cytosine-N4-specific)
MPKSDLPFGSEFSPSQIELVKVLELAHQHGGDWKAFEAAVRAAYFEKHKTSDYNRGKLANNTKLGMQAYGIIDDHARLTDLGKKLYSLRDDEQSMYREFARHILLHCNGTVVVQCVLDMEAGGEKIDLIKLRQWLDERGVHVPRGGRHPSSLRLWLEKAGIFTPGSWRVDEARLEAILGTTSYDIEILAKFSREQRDYLKTLANMGAGSYASNEVEKLAATTYGTTFNEKNLPKSVLYPLQEAGYIVMERGTKEYGRGAKPFVITATDKLVEDLVVPLLKQVEKQTQADLRPFLRKPFGDVIKDLSGGDKHSRGLALEALAIKLMRLIDLTYVATRLRGTATGGAEVDAIFESSRLVFSRWQVQCKNTSRVNLDDVAKEVGLTHALKSTVIVMVSTGEIGGEARDYANKIMTTSNLCIVMVDRGDIEQIQNNPAAIVDVFNREARHAMRIKVLDLKGGPK